MRVPILASVLAMAVVMAATGVSGRRVEAAGQGSKAVASPAVAINLNAATLADLEQLPGVGASMAARILEYRQKSGGFKKIEELMNVQGIGERNFLRLKPLVTVVPPKNAER